ncbi:MAG: hypothetical protein GTO14_16375 [Anaerolineales bacterium]|nr:hypothetical protein [Anaerolineales bacterium]
MKILAQLADDTDLAIFDSPPFLVTDALILASKLHGVLIVMQPGTTRRDEALAMMEQLDRAGAKVLGVVINRIRGRMGLIAGRYAKDRHRFINARKLVESTSGDGRGTGRRMTSERMPPSADKKT